MENQLQPFECISLRIRMINRVLNRMFDKHTRAYGITPSQQTVLIFLSTAGKIPQSMLGKKLMLERSTINREISSLMTKGYVEKNPNGASPLISLTKQGKKFTEKLWSTWEAANKEVRDQIGVEGVNAIDTLFLKIK